MTNALKHAFKGRDKGELFLSLYRGNNNNLELTVKDDGVGLPEDFSMDKPQSFGLKIVSLLAEKQLRGEINVRSNDGGAEFHLFLEKAKQKKRG